MAQVDGASELVERAIAGDRAAVERLLLDNYTPLAGRIAKRLPGSMSGVVSVEDIVQQTYAQAFRTIASFQPREGATVLTWLTAIAENRLRDAIRAQRRKKRGGDFRQVQAALGDDSRSGADMLDALAGRTQTASQSVARRELVHAVRAAVAGLPEEYREAIQLRYFDGYSLDETAVLMGRTAGAVRGLVDRAKKQIRDSLGRASRLLSDG